MPIERIAKLLGLQVKFEPFEGNLSGCTVREENRATVGINSLHHVNRQRFTLAHEIGHFLLHEGKKIIIDRGFRVNLRLTATSAVDDPEEIEANLFAAELLMPESLVRKDLSNKELDIEDGSVIRELADHYKVSSQALIYRLVNLGYIK